MGYKKKISNFLKNKGHKQAIPVEELPNVDIKLRKSSFFRMIYERMRPLRYVVKLDFKNKREYMSNFMPLGEENFLGRGSYKFVYRLESNQVVKIGKPILASDPIFGSLYIKISREPHKYLSVKEMQLMEYLQSQYLLEKNKRKIRRRFYRLGLERLHYEIVKSRLPELVIPTNFFMGVKFREMFFSKKTIPEYMPADIQPYIYGKHIKEFAENAVRIKQPAILDYIHPKWDIHFKAERFGTIKKKTITKLKKDLQSIIELCEYLAREKKLIIDLHSENLIITLPDFEIKLFDFHLFDAHLYEPEERGLNPEKDHIEMIEHFMESLKKM